MENEHYALQEFMPMNAISEKKADCFYERNFKNVTIELIDIPSRLKANQPDSTFNRTTTQFKHCAQAYTKADIYN